jgi:hypothetical protein
VGSGVLNRRAPFAAESMAPMLQLQIMGLLPVCWTWWEGGECRGGVS